MFTQIKLYQCKNKGIFFKLTRILSVELPNYFESDLQIINSNEIVVCRSVN